jgi:UrcA family protein
MTKTFTAAALAIAATLLPISAANAAEPRSVIVSYDGLDLSSRAGQAIFDRRIEKAVETVCGQLTNKAMLDGHIRECRQETLATARMSRDFAVANFGRERFAKAPRTIRFVAH